MGLWSSMMILTHLVAMGAVAFLTLLERKVLGMSQYRLGPNKLTTSGMLQPVVDGVKLLSKDSFRPVSSQGHLFSSTPLLLMFLFLLMWSLVIPWSGSIFSLKNGILVFFGCLAIMAYAVILVGWSSTSVFSKMGSVRGILQSLSYEVALILMFIWVISLIYSFVLSSLTKLNLELALIWAMLVFILSLMEGNRAPFDLLEGESELISGFNIEMGSLMFIYLFLSEYGMIMLMSAVLVLFLTGVITVVPFLVVTSSILMMRSCYPRVRYDSLMGFMWSSILPVSVCLASTSVFLK